MIGFLLGFLLGVVVALGWGFFAQLSATLESTDERPLGGYTGPETQPWQ